MGTLWNWRDPIFDKFNNINDFNKFLTYTKINVPKFKTFEIYLKFIENNDAINFISFKNYNKMVMNYKLAINKGMILPCIFKECTFCLNCNNCLRCGSHIYLPTQNFCLCDLININ